MSDTAVSSPAEISDLHLLDRFTTLCAECGLPAASLAVCDANGIFHHGCSPLPRKSLHPMFKIAATLTRGDVKDLLREFTSLARRAYQAETENAKLNQNWDILLRTCAEQTNRAVRAEAEIALYRATLPTEASEAPIAANLSQAGFTEGKTR